MACVCVGEGYLLWRGERGEGIGEGEEREELMSGFEVIARILKGSPCSKSVITSALKSDFLTLTLARVSGLSIMYCSIRPTAFIMRSAAARCETAQMSSERPGQVSAAPAMAMAVQ